MGAQLLDPFDVEIIRHRFYAIIDESVTALKHVSGSSHTNEGHDLVVALYMANGELMAGSTGFLQHLPAAAQAVKHVLARYGEDPGIFPDDVYLFNDPFSGALHPPDVYLISPIYHDQELTNLVANFVHVTDIGAGDPGGFAPNARESYQEGFQSPGIKLVDRGRIRRDVLETILNMVRDPELTALDIKSQLAANFVAKDRMRELYRDFGADLVVNVGAELIRRAERLTRARLAELPDGTYRARHYLDMPDGIHRLELCLEKSGGAARYDFAGTSAQSVLPINATYWGARGAALAPVFPLLAHDLDWNEGVLKPFDVVAPPRTLVSCEKPAPTSVATIACIHNINHLSVEVLSKMLAASSVREHRATATWRGAIAHMAVHGTRRSGEFFVSQLTDGFAGAGGGRAGRDGVELGGEVCNVVSRVANVESEELHTPVRYLYRRAVTDSGGAGRHRGGVCHEYAITPHRAGSEGLTVSLFGKGLIAPMALGLFGGYPGCQVAYELFRDCNLRELPGDLKATRGKDHESLQWGTFRLHDGDAMYVRGTGGGGYGDPLEREPTAVLRDVAEGFVSLEMASGIYGVVIDAAGMAVDLARTKSRRLALRSARAGHTVASKYGEAATIDRSAVSVSDRPLFVSGNGPSPEQCGWCGLVLAPDAGSTRAARTLPVSAGGPWRKDSELFRLTESGCPRCGSLLDVQVVLVGDTALTERVR